MCFITPNFAIFTCQIFSFSSTILSVGHYYYYHMMLWCPSCLYLRDVCKFLLSLLHCSLSRCSLFLPLSLSHCVNNQGNVAGFMEWLCFLYNSLLALLLITVSLSWCFLYYLVTYFLCCFTSFLCHFLVSCISFLTLRISLFFISSPSFFV